MGRKFIIDKYQDALKWILNLANVTRKLTRLQLGLSEIDFDVGCRPGMKNQAARTSSRLERGGMDTT